jgi:hypothetical protein
MEHIVKMLSLSKEVIYGLGIKFGMKFGKIDDFMTIMKG